MECNVSLRKLNKISLCNRMFKLLGSKPESPHFFFSHTGTCFLNSYILKSNTNLQNIIQILLCDIGNLGTTSRDHHYQTFLLQLTHCLSDRSSAHAKSLCQRNLHQSLTRFQFALQDCLTQRIKNHIP